jgi:hypothetical protein
MNLKDRILIFLSSISLAIILFWYFGWLVVFGLPVLGLVYVIFGGHRHA